MINRCLTLLFLCIMAYSAGAQNYVTVYEDCNYRGRSYNLTPGNYRTSEMKIGNDMLSCIQIPAGMKVTLYEHDNFSGSSLTLTANAQCINEEWNDRTSSIVVESNRRPGENANDYVTFYSDCYTRGFSRSLSVGTYTGPDLGQLKENISSFTIYGNLRVRAYMTSDNASGYYVNFDDNQPCLNGSYNDRIKSLVVEYRYGGWNNNNNGNNGNNGNNYGGNNYSTIYADCNYRGNSLRLAPGYYQGDKLGLLRFDISSIEIPSNLRAKVYYSNDLSGNYYTINESTNCLSINLNNRIGSLIIEERGYNNDYNNNNYPPGRHDEGVILFTDANYKGQSVSLMPGTYYNMAQIGFPDKSLSSLTVPFGYHVVIYDRNNLTGRSFTINESRPNFFLTGWNDKASSITVYRDR